MLFPPCSLWPLFFRLSRVLKTVTTFALLPFRLFHKGRKNEICVTK
ncbi:FIG00554814: hypothetical protein [Cronobacter turicensis 564]|nr:FIG00554814: hypothetical protein [Cronobacter turicensis 564]